MKKNFFKKLSFVLASAMVLTALAPASGAFAAKGPKLNASEKYLFVGEGKKREEYNFNINNKKSGWKYEWASLDEDVVEVNKKNGVAKAVGIGTTKVAVTITDKDGELVDELEAKVIVKDNIKEVKISNPVEGTLGIGELHDFNRSFVTYGGSTKKTTAITRWEVAEEGATIDDSGKFTATVPGEYTVIARSFQSKSKYNSWLKDAEKYAKYVLATDEVKVTVANAMEVKQLDLDTFKLTFAAPVKDVEKNLVVSNIVGTAKVNQYVKKVSMDETNKVATVDMYTKFVEDTTYVVELPELDEVKFVSATSKPEDVVDVKITTPAVEIGDAKEIGIALYNKDGVNIADEELLSRVTLETSSNASYLDGRRLTMFTVGDTTTITATYHSFKYDTTTGEEVGNIVVSAVVRCVEELADGVTKINAYTIVNGTTPNWNDVKHSLAVDDSKRLFVQLLTDIDDDNEIDDKIDNSQTVYSSAFKFESSNTDVLIIDETTGDLFPVNTGAAVVIVKYNDNVVGTVQITVSAKREVTSVVLSKTAFELSNKPAVEDKLVVTATVKDQLGEKLDASNYSVNIYRSNADAVVTESGVDRDGNIFARKTAEATGTTPAEFTFKGVTEGDLAAKVGTHVYYIQVEDLTSHKKVNAYVTVTVKAPSSDTVSYYRVETDKSSYDMKLTKDDKNEDVNFSLFGYASNGVKTERVDITTPGGFDVKVKAPNGTEINVVTPGAVTTDGKFSLVTNNTGATKVSKADKGTYKVTAYNASGAAVNATYFTVTDTQEAPTVTVDKLYTANALSVAAIDDCFTITLHGEEITGHIEPITSAMWSGSGNSIFIKYVEYKEVLGDNAANDPYILHTIKINRTIKINQ